MTDNNASWERETINKLAQASLVEQRRSRRWGIFFKILTFVYIGFFLFMLKTDGNISPELNEDHTALVNINGVIDSEQDANADYIISALRSAFKAEKVKGVILRMNSPGGSPVQSGYIYDEIVRLKKEYPKMPLYAVISDICASGCYYIAAAADKIYADKASIVGSIGVIMEGFGFVDAMEKVGIESRTITAGKNKALLNPFKPKDEKTTAHLKGMLGEIHQQFINAVKKGRGERLDTSIEGLFSGLIWTGESAVKIGLIDALASSGFVAKEVIGEEKVIDYTYEEDILNRLANRVGLGVTSALQSTLFSSKIY